MHDNGDPNKINNNFSNKNIKQNQFNNMLQLETGKLNFYKISIFPYIKPISFLDKLNLNNNQYIEINFQKKSKHENQF